MSRQQPMNPWGGHDERQHPRHTQATAGVAANRPNRGRDHRRGRPGPAGGGLRRQPVDRGRVGELRGGNRVLPVHALPRGVEVPRPGQQRRDPEGRRAATRGQQLPAAGGTERLRAPAPEHRRVDRPANRAVHGDRRLSAGPGAAGAGPRAEVLRVHALPRGAELARSHPRFPGTPHLRPQHQQGPGRCRSAFTADQHQGGRMRTPDGLARAAAGEPMTAMPAPHPQRRRRRRGLLVAGVAVVILAGAGAAANRAGPHGAGVLHPGSPAASGAADGSAPTSTFTVTRRSLSSQTSVGGALGYAGDYTVLGQAQGTITWLPDLGQVVDDGQVLYRVNEKPVVLLFGPTPAYRALAAGPRAADVTGSDVRQLNDDLVAMGHITASELGPSSDAFSWATTLGLQRLQAALGVTATGRLALGDYVFLPRPVRVTGLLATLGGQAGGPVLKGTSTARQVTVDLDASEQSMVRVGDQVSITL